MEKENANISLQSAAQLRRCGLQLALRKGIGELCCRRRHIRRKAALPPDTAALPLSMIICTLGTCKVLEDAIRAALMQDLPQSDYEVLIVWNRADAPPAADFPPQVRWVREPETGLSRARNTGAAHARGAVLLFVDDDAVAAPNLASVMKETFFRHKDAAIVGGQIFLTLPRPRPAAVLSGQEALWSAYRVPYRRYRTVREPYAFPFGACFAIRRSVLFALGGFSENYGRTGENYAGGEETALCYLSRQRGWNIGIQPKAQVEHRVDARRFTLTHAKKTLQAGIYTTYRLCLDGCTPFVWDLSYLKNRCALAARELAQLECGSLAYQYKKWEYEAFGELCMEEMKRRGRSCADTI